jgi:hypothetical protein
MRRADESGMVSPAPPAPSLAARWRPLAVRLLVVAAAIVLGLALQDVVTERLAAIQARSQSDLLGARRELALLLRVGAVALFGLTGGIGVATLLSSRRALSEGRFPPSGTWSLGRARPPITGPRARQLATAGLVLGALLVAFSALAGGLVWYVSTALLACRAGVV